MSWVRYDDGFHEHDKVLPLRAECVEALALHILANCWTSRSDRPGFVPAHLPALLLGDRDKAHAWAKALVKVKLWRKARGGWEFVNHEKYRASTNRQTPGTPTDLSEKRAAAGRKGGKAAQQSKQNGKQTVQQNEQVSEQTSSKPCSPVVASNEATPVPEPVPTTSGLAVRDTEANLGQVVAAYVDGATSAGLPRPTERLRGKVGKDARRLAEKDHVPLPALITAARSMGSRGWDDLDRELQRVAADSQATSTTDQRVAAGLALVDKYREAEGA